MLVSGKYVILTVGALAISAATFAIWFNMNQSRQCVQLWGRETAKRFLQANRVELMRMEPIETPVPENSKEFVKWGTNVLRTVESKECTNAPGFLNLRRDLIEDGAFDWTKQPSRGKIEPQTKLLGLGFMDTVDHGQTTLLILDLKSGEVIDVTTSATAVLDPDCREEFVKFYNEQFAPAAH